MATNNQATPLYPRKRAMSAGFKVYTTESPCQHCGTYARYTSNALCVECDKTRKAARLADPSQAAAQRAKTAARVAAYRARKKGKDQPAGGKSSGAAFDDILG